MGKENYKMDEGKVKKQFEKSQSKAEELLKDPEKAKKILEDAMKKANKDKGPLEKVWEELQLMFSIVKDWFSGEYKEVPVGSIIAILGAIVYFFSPVDVIPDIIPVAGYIDDVFVISLVIKQVRADLEKYRVWKEYKTQK